MSVKSDIETVKNELMSLRTLGIMSGSKHIEAKGDSGLAALDRIAASHEELCTALEKITVGCEGNVDFIRNFDGQLKVEPFKFELS